MTEAKLFKTLGLGWITNSASVDPALLPNCNWVTVDWTTPDNVAKQLANYLPAFAAVRVICRNIEDTLACASLLGPRLNQDVFISYRTEPDQANVHPIEPEEYAAAVEYLSRRHIKVWGPDVCTIQEPGLSWHKRFIATGMHKRLFAVACHGYSGTPTMTQPEDLVTLIPELEAM